MGNRFARLLRRAALVLPVAIFAGPASSARATTQVAYSAAVAG